MTNHWKDIKNADVVLVMGANPAENHPCGFKWALEARDDRGAQIVTVDPRYTRTSAVADRHLQIRPGSDIAMLGGFIRKILEEDLYHEEYVRLHTNASVIVAEGFGLIMACSADPMRRPAPTTSRGQPRGVVRGFGLQLGDLRPRVTLWAL